MKLIKIWFKKIKAALLGDIISSPFENRSYTAFSVATGLFWAFTPTVFFQQAAIGGYWVCVRRTPLKFNLPLAWAWTWISNPWTLAPLYFSYYYVGQMFLRLFGYDNKSELSLDFGSVEAFWANIRPVIVPLACGSLMFSIAFAALGYLLVRRFIWWKFSND